MNTRQLSRLRRLLSLAYPVRIICSADGVQASIPDLDGVQVSGDSISSCYFRLEVAKRAHLTQRLQAGQQVASPNSHLPRRLSQTSAL